MSKLPKPIAVLKKRQAAGEPSTSESADKAGESTVHFDVIGVVRRKLHFKSRPKALISKIEPAAAGKAASGKRAGSGVNAAFFAKRSRGAAATGAE